MTWFVYILFFSSSLSHSHRFAVFPIVGLGNTINGERGKAGAAMSSISSPETFVLAIII
jgi:hypothetical protein